MINIEELYDSLKLREGKEREFKSAKGGMPHSLWETYAAMANTSGGYIFLGISQTDDKHFDIQGLKDPLKIEKDFWNTINNKGKVSANLLKNADAQIQMFGEKALFVIEVPFASRRQRPVFLNKNPLTGTFRRYNDGDYRCDESEVRRMLSDQSEISADSRILTHFSEDDLDANTLSQYRNRMSAFKPNHPWLTLGIRDFLTKLGGWREDRQTKQHGLCAAGLLMFGKEESLRSPENELKFHVDYRERQSDSIGDRWLDRLTPDGTWTPNLFQFYQKAYQKLVDGLKLPFAYQPLNAPFRQGFSSVHEAIQEALVNALIHADYQGQGGVVIERFRDRFELSNPGTLLVSIEQWSRGSVSECRNPSLQLMFQFIGAGDRAGSGVDKIRHGWVSQPQIEAFLKPERVRLSLQVPEEPEEPEEPDSMRNDENLSHNEESSMRNEESSMRNEESSMRNDSVLSDPELLAISAPARENLRTQPKKIREIIRQLCKKQYLTLAQISDLLGRDTVGLRNRFIQDMLKRNELMPLHDKPNHPKQAYKTKLC